MTSSGYTLGTGTAVASIIGSWGTSVSLAQSTAAYRPTLAAGIGPDGGNLIQFDRVAGQYFTFSDTGVMTKCSLFVVFEPTLSAITSLFGKSAIDNAYMRVKSGAGGLEMQTVGGSVVDINLPREDEGLFVINKQNLQALILTYDSTVNGGRVETWLDGLGPAVTTSVGTGGLNFGRLGSRNNNTTNPFDGYMNAAGIYSGKILTTGEIARLAGFLGRFRGTMIYVDPDTGSDASTTPWRQATPFQTLAYATDSSRLRGGEIIAPKGGAIAYVAERVIPTDKVPSGKMCTINGALWGDTDTPFEQRCAAAPAVTLVSGTVYECDVPLGMPLDIDAIGTGATTLLTVAQPVSLPAGSIVYISAVPAYYEVLDNPSGFSITIDLDTTGSTPFVVGDVVQACRAPWASTQAGTPTNFTYYVPGGEIVWTGTQTRRGLDNSNVIRMSQAADGTALPTSQTWSLYAYTTASQKIRFNAGVAVANGEMIVPLAPNGLGLSALQVESNGWQVQNIQFNFSGYGGVYVRGGQCRFLNVGTYFCSGDGQDAFSDVDGDDTTAWRYYCSSAWNGGGRYGGGSLGGPGDGYSAHGTSSEYNFACDAVMNDKSQIDNTHGSTGTSLGCQLYGPRPVRLANETGYSAGALTILSSEIIVPAGMTDSEGYGVWYDSASAPPLLSLAGNTIWGASQAANYIGIKQDDASFPIARSDNLITGFNVAQQGVNTTLWTGSHNGMFDNVTNYSNVNPSTGDVLADPQFVDAPTDLGLEPDSPMIGAGVAISGLDTDFTGATRSDPPSIGAYEQ